MSPGSLSLSCLCHVAGIQNRPTFGKRLLLLFFLQNFPMRGDIRRRGSLFCLDLNILSRTATRKSPVGSWLQ
jgi:hypothetical protein